ncbi:MAG: hypothetical protein ACK2U1_07545 [Anaerolineales bacterium]
MVPRTKLDTITNPIDLLDNVLEQTWDAVCEAYDVSAEMPSMQNIFMQAPLGTPPKAAECVVVNMLTEVTECMGRFSPWYKQPARAFGLVSLRDSVTGKSHWLLAPEALQHWQPWLQKLTQVIKLNNGLIQATLLVENLSETDLQDPLVIAQCGCYPPKRIQIGVSILEKTAIICDACHQPFE